MTFISFPAIILSFWVLAAHFFRGGSLLLTALALLLPLLLLIPERWAARVMQAALGMAALEWTRTTVVMAQERLSAGEPYIRMACILGAVIIITVLSALTFSLPALKRRYKLNLPPGREET